METSQELERVIVVLNEPKDPVNVGSVVRAMKNMGLERLRLVRPDAFDVRRVEGVAHTGADLIEATESFDDLPTAIADAGLVVGTTARGRRVRRSYLQPREAVAEIMSVARAGADVALVFGREDRGLSNAELDLCGRVVVIPTDPSESSINLAQSVLILAYELFLASDAGFTFKEPRRPTVRASAEELRLLTEEVELSLAAIDFFKYRSTTAIMRTVREVVGQANLDSRAAGLFRAMAIEVRKFLDRRGIPPSNRPE